MQSKKKLENRKRDRLEGFDYSSGGAYFLTICTKDMRRIFGNIVGEGVLDVPKMQLSEYGLIIDKQIKEISGIYDNISVDKYDNAESYTFSCQHKRFRKRFIRDVEDAVPYERAYSRFHFIIEAPCGSTDRFFPVSALIP